MEHLSDDTFQFIGCQTGELYSVFTPYGQTDEEIAHNLNAEYDILRNFWKNDKDWGIDEPLSIIVATDVQ